LLRLIAGLVRPQSGSIQVAGQDITRLSETQMYEVRRKLGMLFQGGALLDSLNVFDNLAFPLREHTSLDEAQIRQAVHQRLEAVGLDDVDDLLPSQLSGGMLRRVALARAIMLNPEILLCDEPFSGLDPISVKRIEALLGQMNRRLKMTVLIVSHHIASTMRLASHVVLLLEGGAVAGSPAELRSSSDADVAEFFRDDAPEPSVDDALATPRR
jgi:phospholipid/cholesterol/gamma-HCH transport system ATP-binding protein